MEAEIRGALGLIAWSAAFWIALLRAAPAARPRLAAGLALGAAAARAGFALQHPAALLRRPALLLDASGGASALFVPLGILASAPWRRRGPGLAAHLDAGLGALPLALAAARLGCLAAGCCPGLPTELPWGMRAAPDAPAVHPHALYEVAGLCALASALDARPGRRRAGLALAGWAALRALLDPLRAPSPLGPPRIPPPALAAGWAALGLILASPWARRLLSPPVPRRSSP